MRYLLVILLFTSCMTERKVSAYLDDHPGYAAQQCANRFPIRDSTIIHERIDTAGYERFIGEVLQYADSVAEVAEQRNKAIRDVQAELNTIRSQKEYTDDELERLQKKLDAVKPIDIAVIRKSVEAEVRAKLKPCKDSIITVYKENTAKVKQLESTQTELTRLQSGKKDLSTLFGWLLSALIKKWWFWLIVVALAGWVYWRIRAGALNSVLSKIKKL